MADSELLTDRPTVWAILRANANWLLASALLGFLLALAYTHLVTPKYRISLTLVPSEENAAAVAALGSSSGLSSLASLAGVNLPTGTNALSFELFPDAIHSRETADVLAREPAIMQAAFARYWDPASKRWVEPTGALYRAGRMVRAALGYRIEPFAAPDGYDLQAYLKKQLVVTKDRKRPVIDMSIEHADRDFGKTLLVRIAQVTDARLKSQILDRSSKNIQYLGNRLNETQNIEYRNFLYLTMSQEEKRVMSTSNGLPYVAEPFGDPVASLEPVVPNVPAAIGLGVLGGLVVGLVLVGIRQRRLLVPALTGLLKDQ